MAEFLLEIGCEELPARFIRPALTSLSELMLARIGDAGLEYSDVQTFGTPRRLGLVIQGLPERQKDRTEQVQGPKVAICFDAEGQPTKVALGFAKGQGVEVADLERVETPKGEVVQITKTLVGRPTADVLAGFIAEALPKIAFPKSMRWAAYEESFARPVHWMVALFDGVVVPVRFAGIESSNESRGHRFLSPESFEVTDFSQYLNELETRYVLVDIDRRMEEVVREANQLAKEAGGKLIEDAALFEEVANITEYPVPLLGHFDPEFLEVPKEILILTMAAHQRYFAVEDPDGKLLPTFVFFSNTKVEDPSVVSAGNARVLRARLSDARFFFREDQKHPLEHYAAKLKKVTFEERLGTIAEKIGRIEEHIRYMTSFVAPDKLELALQAAALCKADLQTSVVFEFTELQGVMGRIYGEIQGLPTEVCRAIEQHYWPTNADGELPQDDVAAMVALADKMDTLAGCFGVGLKPSGSADPYALRRQALGILRILSDKGYRLSLPDWVGFAVRTLGEKLTRPAEEVVADVLAFIEARYRHLTANAYSMDTIDAVLAVGLGVLAEADRKIEALHRFRQQDGFESLAAAFKRVMNILKERTGAVVSPDLFQAEAERNLWAEYQRHRDEVSILSRKGEFLGALQAMVDLKALVDQFFNDVMVMDKDEAVRTNRLALLEHLADMFSQIADFRKIQTVD
jgi:glycyl-tRNA synthetase beta chain